MKLKKTYQDRTRYNPQGMATSHPHGEKKPVQSVSRDKIRKGIDFDITMAWYDEGGCPLRQWPHLEDL